jgi:Flp pilus assembly protein TadG
MNANGSTRTGVALGRQRRFRPDSGQSLLEVALLLPMLIALLLGVIELGRYAYISILVANAARAGAAYGAQSLEQSVDTAGIQGAAGNDFQNNGQNPGSLSVTSLISCGCDSNGGINNSNTGAACGTPSNPGAGSNCGSGTHWVVMVSVTASGTFNSLFSYPGIPSTLTVSSTATLRVPQI